MLPAFRNWDIMILGELGLRITKAIVAAIEIPLQDLLPFLFGHAVLSRGLYGSHPLHVGLVFIRFALLPSKGGFRFPGGINPDGILCEGNRWQGRDARQSARELNIAFSGSAHR